MANDFKEMPDFSCLPNLVEVSLANNRITSSARIRTLPAAALQKLDLRSNKISHFEGLTEEHSSLTWYSSGDFLVAAPSLAHLFSSCHFARLSLSSNGVSKLDLPRLPHLEFLGVHGSSLPDVSFLHQTPNLKRLTFSSKLQPGQRDQDLLWAVLKLVPGLRWLNGTFITAAMRNEILNGAAQ